LIPARFGRNSPDIMIPTKKSHTLSLLICTVIPMIYFAGYAKIRMNCENFGGSYFVAPEYVRESTSLRAIYRPCFQVEERFTGNQFTVGLWGMIKP
jgi:hypothetical protein